MFMKLLFSITLFLCLCFQAFSQDKNSKLLLSYSQEELNLIEQADEHQFQLLNYAVDHAIYTSEYHEAKHSSLPVISLKESANNPTFTDFGLKIKDQNQYFYWESEGKLLVVKSFWVLNQEKQAKL
tara:strand:+ start:19923 stop:20300 length:378 start_codon:yes stop_codon:yes gene_type:complete